jgi:hypothetical protein
LQIFVKYDIIGPDGGLMDKKKDNFKRIAENRTNKIIDLISKLHNLTNTSFYEYDYEQIEKMFNAIQQELDKQKKEFERIKNTPNKRIEL